MAAVDFESDVCAYASYKSGLNLRSQKKKRKEILDRTQKVAYRSQLPCSPTISQLLADEVKE